MRLLLTPPSGSAVMVCACAVVLAPPTAHATNYLVVVLDDVGVDKISSYASDYSDDGYVEYDAKTAPNGYQFLPNTPVVDALADAGIRFKRAWAAPSCSPTRASIMTGAHPFRHGVGFPLGDSAPGVDVTAFDMFASEYASLTGAEAGLFGKWHIGSLDEALNSGAPGDFDPANYPIDPLGDAPHPVTAGFERFYGTLEGEVDDYDDWVLVEWDDAIPDGSADFVTLHASSALVDEGATWIDARKGDWLAFVTFHAPHDPWTESDVPTECLKGAPSLSTNCVTDPKQKCGKDLAVEVYQTQLECADWYFGNLLDDLETAGELDDTLIFVFGDNGTPLEVQEGVFADAAVASSPSRRPASGSRLSSRTATSTPTGPSRSRRSSTPPGALRRSTSTRSTCTPRSSPTRARRSCPRARGTPGPSTTASRTTVRCAVASRPTSTTASSSTRRSSARPCASEATSCGSSTTTPGPACAPSSSTPPATRSKRRR